MQDGIAERRRATIACPRHGCGHWGLGSFHVGFGLSVLALIAATGCGSSSAPPAARSTAIADATNASGPASLSAADILRRMADVYRTAGSYEDAGQLRERAVVGGIERESPAIAFSIAFERPDRIRAHLFNAMLVSDGKTMHAAVDELEGQVLQIAAPQHLADAFQAVDPVLHQAMTAGRPLFESIQLSLLLAPEAEQAIRGDIETARIVDEQAWHDRPCYRVETKAGDDRRYLYWIDKERFTLRRLDLPTKALREAIDSKRDVRQLDIWIDLKAAAVEQPIDPKAFMFEVPANARRLVRFVTPLPGPRPPKIGDKIESFSFRGLDGTVIDDKALQGKIKVLDFWFTTCPPCRLSAPVLEALYRKYRDNEDVAFLAVSVDSPNVAGETIEEKLRQWGASMPIARDLKQQNQSVFEISGAPSTFLLGRDNVVHGYKIGYHPNYDEFASSIERLLAGEDVAERILAEYEAAQQDYEMRLASAKATPDASLIEVPQARITPRKMPATLHVERIWQCSELDKPGNILVVNDRNHEPRIYVLAGWKQVALLDAQGHVIGRHKLALEESAAAGFLRTGLDADGTRLFVVSGAAQQKLYLFDHQWQLVWSFPDEDHDGIADARVSDLQGDGSPEIVVGYWGVAGVQCLSRAAALLWSNRSLENVMQVAVTGPDATGRRQLWCINNRGTLVPIDADGQHGSDMRIPDRAMIHIASGDVDGDGAVEFCGLAAEGIGKRIALGLSRDGDEQWSHALPEGVHQQQIDPIVPVRLAAGDGGWLLPGPDGSIHWLTKDGEIIDQFAYGEALTGLAMTELDGRTVLLVATADDVSAWHVRPPAQ